MGFLKALNRIFVPQLPDEQKRGKGAQNKASVLIDEIVYAFEESVETSSTARSLMFHSAYVAYVPEKYFNNLHLSFGVITKEIVDIFHEKLNERLAKHKKLKFAPLSNSWSFDIISLGKDCSIMPDPNDPESIVTFDELEENFVAVRSSLVPKDMFNFSEAGEDDTIRTNRSQPSSTFNRIQMLSISAIRGLKPSGNGFTYPIDLTGGQVADAVTSASDKVLAVLASADFDVRFTDKTGNKYESLNIKLNNFFVGGPSADDMYYGKPLVHLDSESVMNPHFEVKREEDGSFHIRPIGVVELNGIPLTRNVWARLSDRNSSIKINGDIELVFNKK